MLICPLSTSNLPARDTTSEYIAWGHSTIVDPWGKIVSKANEGEETIVADLGKMNKKPKKQQFNFYRIRV